MDFEQKTSSFSVSLSSVLLFRVVKFYGGWKRKRSFWCLCHLFFLSFFLFLKTPLPAPRTSAQVLSVYI